MDLTDEPLDVDLDAWDAWTPAEASRRLGSLKAPWYVIAGWALDLFLGRQTRDHHDLEIGVPEHRFAEVRALLPGFEFVAVGDGRGWPLTDAALARYRQTWAREPGGPWRIDVMRELWHGNTWICRRDSRIRLDASRLISRTAEGIPFMQPEVVLLFKAKAVRPKDELDFAAALPRLDVERRDWLRAALTLVHPGHPWLGPLRTG